MSRDAFRGTPREPESPLPADDAGRLSDAAARLVDDAVGGSWYTHPANEVDRALVALCRLRRAGAARKRAPEGGDDEVRAVLETAKPEAVVWLASRVVSYLDEHGFPEDLEPWLEREP